MVSDGAQRDAGRRPLPGAGGAGGDGHGRDVARPGGALPPGDEPPRLGAQSAGFRESFIEGARPRRSPGDGRGHVPQPGGLRLVRLPQQPRRRLRPPRLPVGAGSRSTTRSSITGALYNNRPMGFYPPRSSPTTPAATTSRSPVPTSTSRGRLHGRGRRGADRPRLRPRAGRGRGGDGDGGARGGRALPLPVRLRPSDRPGEPAKT